MEEEFRPIKGFEGLYEMSNLMRFRSLTDCNSLRSKYGILKPSSTSKVKNHKRYTLFKDRGTTIVIDTRLFDETFPELPPNHFYQSEIKEEMDDEYAVKMNDHVLNVIKMISEDKSITMTERNKLTRYAMDMKKWLIK